MAIHHDVGVSALGGGRTERQESPASPSAQATRQAYDGTTTNEIIADLALSPEHHDKTAEELWPHFYARLEALGHSPEEILHPSEPRKCVYRYEFAEKHRQIGRGRFANVVATAREAAQSR
jgi:hypothetical protein